LYLNGKNLRTLSLIERQRQLRKLLRRKRSRILYLDHAENDGRSLFEQIVKMDLEGCTAGTAFASFGNTSNLRRSIVPIPVHRSNLDL